MIYLENRLKLFRIMRKNSLFRESLIKLISKAPIIIIDFSY